MRVEGVSGGESEGRGGEWGESGVRVRVEGVSGGESGVKSSEMGVCVCIVVDECTKYTRHTQ